MVSVAHLKKYIKTLGPKAKPKELMRLVEELGDDNEIVMSGIADEILGIHADDFFRRLTKDPEYISISRALV